MTIAPPSGREDYQGLDSYYEDEIVPFLQSQETRRRSAVMHSGVVFVFTVAVAIAVYVLGPLGEANLHIAFIIGALGLSFAVATLTKARSNITAGLLKRVCGFLGFTYRREPSRPSFASELDRLRLLPSYNRQSWEDEVIGLRHGADFVLCEAHLKKVTRGKRKRVRTVFHGQLLLIDYHKQFFGETVIKRDAGVFNRLMKPGKEFQNVGLVSSRFEKAFEAWSTDQVEARELLDPLVLERFEELERLFDGARFRAAFSKGKLYVVLETGDKLNMGSMFNSLERSDRVEAILKEFDLIFDLIDVLLKRIDGPLDAAVSVDALRA
ncbi:MAG: DUF3137 domain-containing protein [Pseudomonadota bacterium]